MLKKEDYGFASFSYVSLHLNYSFLCAHSFPFPSLSVTSPLHSISTFIFLNHDQPHLLLVSLSVLLCFITPLFPLPPCSSTQDMRSQVWWRWGPYMRLHRSNHRMTALSYETSLCRTLSRASSVQPDPSASKLSMSESPSNFILLHSSQHTISVKCLDTPTHLYNFYRIKKKKNYVIAKNVLSVHVYTVYTQTLPKVISNFF